MDQRLKPLPPLFSGANRLSLLITMKNDVQKMIDSETDEALGIQFEGIPYVSRLDKNAVKRLESVVVKIDALRKKIKNEKEGENTPATIDMICDCPITVRFLKEAKIVSIADLIEADPTTLVKVLLAAEKENGHVRQHQLFLWRWYMAKKSLNLAFIRHAKYPHKKPEQE